MSIILSEDNCGNNDYPEIGHMSFSSRFGISETEMYWSLGPLYVELTQYPKHFIIRIRFKRLFGTKRYKIMLERF